MTPASRPPQARSHPSQGIRSFRARLGRIGAGFGAHLATFALAATFGLAAYGAVSLLVRLERYLLD